MTNLVVHGHFYQPPREHPFTDRVPRQPSAAPFHDWNERITAECYRPNAFARVLDEQGRVVAIVNNFELLSFNVGPTLASWLERHAPDVYDRVLSADRVARTAIAQGYHHIILPLANERDRRTQVRWGLADFAHRFGRPAQGMWLPETAVNDAVLATLVEEGVEFTILAPGQAASKIEPGRAYRWIHPTGKGSIAVLFYDGPLSHDVAFGVGGQSAGALVERAVAALPGGKGLALVATDGETFGHHHKFTERAIAYALAVESPRRGVSTRSLGVWLAAHPPTEAVAVRESAWSCAHGVGRWKEDCGCSTGGATGSNQRWRKPLRDALDLLRDHAARVFEQRGGAVLHDPWAARDDYVRVLLDPLVLEDFTLQHVKHDADVSVAITLLESQRHAMAMYTSCGWFFHDLAGIETIQVLLHASACLTLLERLGDEAPLEVFLTVLDTARSNDPLEGTGRQIWRRHVAGHTGDEDPDGLASALAERFGEALDRLLDEHQRTIDHLLAANETLPAELRDVAAVAYLRRVTTALRSLADQPDQHHLDALVTLLAAVERCGLTLDPTRVGSAADRALGALARQATRSLDRADIERARLLVELGRDHHLGASEQEAQEVLYEALVGRTGDAGPLGPLGVQLGLVVGHLGPPG